MSWRRSHSPRIGSWASAAGASALRNITDRYQQQPYSAMDILSPLILLHQNGYKALTEIPGREDLGLATVEVQGKVLCLAAGDINGADSAAQVRLKPAVQTTLRNQNQGEPQMAQTVIDVAETSKEERVAKAAENPVAEGAKTVRGRTSRHKT
jgi:hypothetical protein